MEIKMNRKKFYFTWVLVFVLSGFMAAVLATNKDKPAKGEYVFPLEQVWQLDGVGEKPFSRVVEIPVSDAGYVYCRDLKNKEYYAVSPDGKYLATFGTPGEGPGEVKQSGQASIAVVGDKVVIEGTDKILYFDKNGKYLRSQPNNSGARPPVIYLNEDEFISAPRTIQGTSKGKAQMKHVNLKTGTEKVLTDFSVFKGSIFQQGNVRAVAVIPSITPVMVIGDCDGKLYFGMNSEFRIYIADMTGKEQGSFGIERKQSLVTLEQKEKVMLDLIKGLAPDEVAKQLAKTLPDKETYFDRMEEQDGMLYVYRSKFVPGGERQIDIFTPAGKYMYRTFVRVKEGLTIVTGPTIKNGCIYMVLEDEDGEITLNKYKTQLPH